MMHHISTTHCGELKCKHLKSVRYIEKLTVFCLLTIENDKHHKVTRTYIYLQITCFSKRQELYSQATR